MLLSIVGASFKDIEIVSRPRTDDKERFEPVEQETIEFAHCETERKKGKKHNERRRKGRLPSDFRLSYMGMGTRTVHARVFLSSTLGTQEWNTVEQIDKTQPQHSFIFKVELAPKSPPWIERVLMVFQSVSNRFSEIEQDESWDRKKFASGTHRAGLR